LADLTGLGFEEVMVLWDDIPRQAFRGTPSLFDRRFNTDPFARAAAWPANGLPRDLPLAPTSATTDSTLARVLSALRMNEADFVAMVDALEDTWIPEPGSTAPVRLVTRTSSDRLLRLSTGTLAVLHRHALLCKVLKVKPAVLMRLVRLTPEIAARAT